MSMFRSSRRQSTPDLDILVPEVRARGSERRIFTTDVEDADFVEISDKVERGFGNDNRSDAGVKRVKWQEVPNQPFWVLIGAVEHHLRRMSIDGFAVLIAAAICCAFLLSGGFSVLSSASAGGGKVTNPLGISYVNVIPEYVDGHEILVIRGVIENSGDELMAVPKILASLSATKGEFVASMIIQPPISEIKPGNSHGFSAKIRHPGGKTPDIKLSFMQTDVSQR